MFKLDPSHYFNVIYKNLKEDENNFVKFWHGPKLIIFIKYPTHAIKVFNECLNKGALYDFVDLKGSIVFGSGKVWKTQRAALNRHFSTLAIRKLFSMFDEKSEILVKNLEKNCDAGEFDVFYPIAGLTLESILTAMGSDVDLQNAKEEERDKPVLSLNR
jgi:cytochrome P450